MTKQEELDLFLLRCDELIESKYILADVKIVNLLKSIANSKTLLAIFQTCLKDFNYEKEATKCFITSAYLGGDKGEFKQPDNSKTLLALVFSILMDIDAKNIDFSQLLNKYFYENGSYYQSYNAFVKALITPFKFTVKTLMVGIIKGSVGDPVTELSNGENPQENKFKNAVEGIKEILVKDREKLNALKEEDKKAEGLFIVNTFEQALDSEDKESIRYAFIAYKYTIGSIFKFINKVKAVQELLNTIND